MTAAREMFRLLERGEILGYLVERLGTIGQVEKGAGIASSDA